MTSGSVILVAVLFTVSSGVFSTLCSAVAGTGVLFFRWSDCRHVRSSKVSVCTTTLSSFHVFLGAIFWTQLPASCPRRSFICCPDLYPVSDCVAAYLPVSQFPGTRCQFCFVAVALSLAGAFAHQQDQPGLWHSYDVNRFGYRASISRTKVSRTGYNKFLKVWPINIVVFMKVLKIYFPRQRGAGLGPDIFLILIKFGYKAFGFRSMTFLSPGFKRL